MLALPLAAAALGAWAYGTYEPNSPLFGRVIGRGSRRGRVAYLTFDDGPNAGATEPILATLAAHQVPTLPSKPRDINIGGPGNRASADVSSG